MSVSVAALLVKVNVSPESFQVSRFKVAENKFKFITFVFIFIFSFLIIFNYSLSGVYNVV